jgi:hypothetical protein
LHSAGHVGARVADDELSLYYLGGETIFFLRKTAAGSYGGMKNTCRTKKGIISVENTSIPTCMHTMFVVVVASDHFMFYLCQITVLVAA